MKSKWTRSSIPSFFKLSTTEPKFDRKISGYVLSCISDEYAFSVYKRKHFPGRVRPARPARCWAEAWKFYKNRFFENQGRKIPLYEVYLGDGRDQEGFDSDTRVVDFLLGKTWINDENDTVNGQRSFGNVGGDDNLAADGAVGLVWRRRLENSLLLLGWQCWVEGDDFHIADFGAHFFNFVSNSFTRVFNLLLTSQKQQTIALLLLAQVNLNYSSKTINYKVQ